MHDPFITADNQAGDVNTVLFNLGHAPRQAVIGNQEIQCRQQQRRGQHQQHENDVTIALQHFPKSCAGLGHDFQQFDLLGCGQRIIFHKNALNPIIKRIGIGQGGKQHNRRYHQQKQHQHRPRHHNGTGFNQLLQFCQPSSGGSIVLHLPAFDWHPCGQTAITPAAKPSYP